ncbi:MAG: Beta-ketoacyl synthase [Myxococcaceae bacterium]|nr:Beta-ketoacyl synthase [Myxococcaceae bacterium]
MSGRVHVDIRAVAALSCYGAEKAGHVAALREGRSGIQTVTASEFVGLRAAVIPGEDKTPQRPFTLIDRIAAQLIESAGLTQGDRRDVGVFVGTTTGIAASEEMAFFQQGALGVNKAWTLLCGGPGRITAHLAQRLGAEGPLFTYTTACTSTAVGMIMALQAIRSGLIRRAVVFGLDTVMRISVEGFRLLKLYSPTVCRPFDQSRNGLQMGEAAAGVVLEARTGPRRSRFEVLDGAIAHDPGHIAAGSADGTTAASVMERALERAGLTASAVTAIKAHGTGTQVNDASELRGLERVFGKSPPPFASLKGGFGHTLGASTALELAAWVWALEEGFVPGSIGFSEAAEGSLVPLARSLPTHGRPGVHLFNSFGFGGTSASFLVEDHGA